MMRAVVLLASGLTLASCGVYGDKGNDTGGIIPWSPEAEVSAMAIAQANCSGYNKFARITSINRQPGNYIAYVCQWDGPLQGRRHVLVR